MAHEEEVEEQLQQESSVIGRVTTPFRGPTARGDGIRAAVLFHQSSFDTAAVLLEPGGTELAETNSTGWQVRYMVI